MKETIKYLEEKLNALSFIDILLNHTSCDSKWLLESKDSYYSPSNTPSMMAASVLDQALNNFSNQISKKEVPEYTKGNLVESEEDVQLIISLFLKNVLPDLKIPQYYAFNVDDIIKQLKENMKKSYPNVDIKENESEIEEESCCNIFAKDKDDILEEILTKNTLKMGVSLQGVSLNFNDVAKNLSENTLKYSYELYRIVLSRMNDNQAVKINNYLNEAFVNLKNQAKYDIVEKKQSVITIDNHIFPKYFTLLKNGELAANNGWILNADPRENFADSDNLHYLRRGIVIWEDLIKLR